MTRIEVTSAPFHHSTRGRKTAELGNPPLPPNPVSRDLSSQLLSSSALGLVPDQSDSPDLIIMSLITIRRIEYYTLLVQDD